MGFISPSIIKYLEPLTGDLLTARFADSIFNEDHFPTLGREFKYHAESQEINWEAKGIANEDPRTQESELQVLRILNLQNIANNLPDAFTTGKDVTKSYIPTRNVNRGNKETYSAFFFWEEWKKYGNSCRCGFS